MTHSVLPAFPRPRIKERSIETHVHLARAHASAKEALYAIRTFASERDEDDALRDFDSRIGADYLVIMHRLLFGEHVRIAAASGPAHFGMVLRVDMPTPESGALFRLRLIRAIERPAAEAEVFEEWANVYITSNITVIYP
jgi:hypothetical protein